MRKALFIAPHPDDESLGCGGTIFAFKNMNSQIHWLIATSMKENHGFTSEQIAIRDKEIGAVKQHYGFNSATKLDFPAASLNSENFNQLIDSLKKEINKIAPTDLFLPFPGDVHSDHKYVFEAGKVC